MARERKRLTREESRKLTRERLLDSAAEVFARKGFYGASVEEIAEEAGYSRGAVYSNFSDKEEMFLALLERAHELDSTLLPEAFRFPDRFQGLLESSVAESRSWSLLSLEFLIHAARVPAVGKKLADRVRAGDAEFADVLRQWLSEANHEPVLPVEQLAQILSAVSTGLGIQALIDPESLPGEAYMAAIERLLADSSGQTPYDKRE